MANSTIGALNVKITADATSVKAGLRQTNKALTTTTKKAKTANKAFSDFSGALNLNTLALSAALGVAATKAVRYADAFTSINNKLKLATEDSKQLAIVTDKLFESSNNTGSSIEASVELYAKLERSTRNLNISQDRLLNITDSINKSFIISGASTAEASGAIRQLGQALSSGALRGEEFNSISEQAPMIMEAVRDATGKTSGELRALAAEGKITSEILIESLERYKKKIDTDYATAQKTFAQKLVASTNAVIKFVGESKSLNVAVDNIGDALVSASENMETIGNVLQGVLIVSIGKYTAGMYAASVATKLNTVETAANMAAKVTLAEVELRRANIAVGFAVQEQAAAKRMLAGTTNTVIRAKAVTNLAIANGKLYTTQQAVIASTVKLSAMQTVATGTTAALSRAMSFLGGPLGVAIMAGLALASFIDWSDDTAASSKLTADEVDNLKDSYSGLSRALKVEKLSVLATEMKSARSEMMVLGDAIEDQKKKLASSTSAAATMFASDRIVEYTDRIDALNNELNILSEKQGLIAGAKTIDMSGATDRTFTTETKTIDIDSGQSDSEKAKIAREKQAAEDFLQSLRDRFLNAEQLENNRYKQEKSALRVLHGDKNKLNAEQKELEKNLEIEHQSNLRKIQQAMPKTAERFKAALDEQNSAYEDELSLLRKSFQVKTALTKEQQAIEAKFKKSHLEKLDSIEKSRLSNKKEIKVEKSAEAERYAIELKALKNTYKDAEKVTVDQQELQEYLKKTHLQKMKEIEDKSRGSEKLDSNEAKIKAKFAKEMIALQQSFQNKNNKTKEQQTQEATLEAAHLEKMQGIKDKSLIADTVVIDTSDESKRYLAELEALRSSFENKTALTKEQQVIENAMTVAQQNEELKLETEHLAKINTIKSNAEKAEKVAIDTSDESARYKTELDLLRQSFIAKDKITSENQAIEIELIAAHNEKLKSILNAKTSVKKEVTAEKSAEVIRYENELKELQKTFSDINNLTTSQADLQESLKTIHAANMSNISNGDVQLKALDSNEAEIIAKFEKELSALKQSFTTKNVSVEQQQALEIQLEKAHLANLAAIKVDDAGEVITPVINDQGYALELEALRQSFADKGTLIAEQQAQELSLKADYLNKSMSADSAAETERYNAELEALRASFNAKGALTQEQQNQEAELKTNYLNSLAEKEKAIEEAKYAADLEALRSSFENKKILTQEQQLALEELELLHLEKMQGIKDSMKPIDTSIGILEALGLQYQTEETMLIESLARKQAILDAALANKSISEDEHEKQTLTIKQQGEEAKRKITLQNVQEGFAILASGSKKAQKLLQGVAVAQAVVSGYGAAVEAWKAGMSTGGPWVAAAYAAASVAKTAGMISQMKSSGSSMASSGGGTPSTSGGSSAGGSTMQQAAPQQAQISAPQVSRTIDINLPSTGLLSVDQVRELMEQINEQVGDGVQLNTGNI